MEPVVHLPSPYLHLFPQPLGYGLFLPDPIEIEPSSDVLRQHRYGVGGDIGLKG